MLGNVEPHTDYADGQEYKFKPRLRLTSNAHLWVPGILYLSTTLVGNNTLCLALRNSIMISLGTVNRSLTPSFTHTETIMWYYRLHFSLCLPDTVSLCELGPPPPGPYWFELTQLVQRAEGIRDCSILANSFTLERYYTGWAQVHYRKTGCSWPEEWSNLTAVSENHVNAKG